MRRKTLIIVSVLLITIVLIGILRFLIKSDTIQTQQDRLHFYSEDLTLQKNTILNSMKNYANLVIEGINYNTQITDLLHNIGAKQLPPEEKDVNTLIKYSESFYLLLHKVGFSFMSYSIPLGQNKVLKIHVDNNSIKIENNTDDPYSASARIPFESITVKDNIPFYQYSYPIASINNLKKSYIEIGFDFSILHTMIRENIPDSFIGFLYYSDRNDIPVNSGSAFDFIQPDRSFNLYFDKNIEKEIHNYLNHETLKMIDQKIIHIDSINSGNDNAIYLNVRQSPRVMSFCPLNHPNNKSKFYLLSVNYDNMLDKTNDWNNQIFLINIIIIVLIMFGITYLFINRFTLINEKEFIRKSELKLKEMNESKDKFFSIIAHDLKNPFNGIMGMTGYLSESYDEISEAEKKEIIYDLNISSKHAFNLLQNLLEWTRSQSGTIKNNPVKIEPENIIEISLETVANLAKSKGIEILRTIITNKHGFADENLATTILRNLLTNAVKFSPRDSSIEIIVKDYDKELVFCVKDNGIGLEHNEVDQLFRIDKNFHKKGTEQETGTGLGLKLCKEFAEYCNGRIWVVSEPSKGSSFFFTVPIYPQAPSA